eukprot:6172560-Pleurochrysis_carterae.AAC.3
MDGRHGGWVSGRGEAERIPTEPERVVSLASRKRDGSCVASACVRMCAGARKCACARACERPRACVRKSSCMCARVHMRACVHGRARACVCVSARTWACARGRGRVAWCDDAVGPQLVDEGAQLLLLMLGPAEHLAARPSLALRARVAVGRRRDHRAFDLVEIYVEHSHRHA